VAVDAGIHVPAIAIAGSLSHLKMYGCDVFNSQRQI